MCTKAWIYGDGGFAQN